MAHYVREQGSVSGWYKTRSSAIAEGPRDASCQLRSCQVQIVNFQYCNCEKVAYILAHKPHLTTYFVWNDADILAVGDRQDPENEKNSRVIQRCAKSGMRRNKTPYKSDVDKIWHGGRYPPFADVTTCANFDDDRSIHFFRMVPLLIICHSFTAGGHLVLVLFFRLHHVPTLATFDMSPSSFNTTGNS